MAIKKRSSVERRSGKDRRSGVDTRAQEERKLVGERRPNPLFRNSPTYRYGRDCKAPQRQRAQLVTHGGWNWMNKARICHRRFSKLQKSQTTFLMRAESSAPLGECVAVHWQRKELRAFSVVHFNQPIFPIAG